MSDKGEGKVPGLSDRKNELVIDRTREDNLKKSDWSLAEKVEEF